MTGDGKPGGPTVIVIMGVAGAGKTTVGRLLAEKLSAAYEEGDAYHSPENVAKMRTGTPLCDADRWPWLDRLAKEIDGWLHSGRRTVLACSALKQKYRDILIGDRRGIVLVYLKGEEAVIRQRLAVRRGHYMPVDLLDSQFSALEEPDDAVTIDIRATPDQIAASIATRLTAI